MFRSRALASKALVPPLKDKSRRESRSIFPSGLWECLKRLPSSCSSQRKRDHSEHQKDVTGEENGSGTSSFAWDVGAAHTRTRKKNFLPQIIGRFQRHAEEICLLIREAFLRGISARQVGRVVATVTGKFVSAQTVSRLMRYLDEARFS